MSAYLRRASTWLVAALMLLSACGYLGPQPAATGTGPAPSNSPDFASRAATATAFTALTIASTGTASADQTPHPLPTAAPAAEVETPTSTPSAMREPSATPQIPSSATPALPWVPGEVIFVDEKHGWMTGSSPVDEAGRVWQPDLARTSDGGASWSALRVPPEPSGYPGHGGTFFADKEKGWRFRSQDEPFEFVLYSTVDGGESWNKENPRGAIVRMFRSLSGEVWALEQFEDPMVWRLLVVGQASYDTWKESMLRVPQDLPLPDDIILQDASHAWFSEWIHRPSDLPEFDVLDFGLVFSSDDGRTWERRATPCVGFGSGTESNATVVGVGESHLWLGCGTAAGAINGTKFVYFSSDGGLTWEQRGSTDDDSLPTGGGYFLALDALSDDLVYITGHKSWLIFLSRDRGHTWEQLVPGCYQDLMRVFFLNQRTAWAYDRNGASLQVCLSRTLDGGRTWQACVLQEDGSCAPFAPP